MAISEYYTSRTMHITADGVTVDVSLTMTWEDFSFGYDSNWTLPDIGDSIEVLMLDGLRNRDDLRCTDIQTVVLDNVNCRVNYLFSTESTDGRREREDQIASWDFKYSTEMEICSDDVYFQTNAAGSSFTQKKWSEEWVDTYGGSADYSPPTFSRYVPKLMLTLNIFGSSLYSSAFQTYLEGRVNSVSFYKWIYDKLDEAGRIPAGSEAPDSSDVGYWLCMDADMERKRYNCFNYNFIFEYNNIGWNKVRKSDGTIVDRIVYPSADFTSMFKGMDLVLPDSYTRET